MTDFDPFARPEHIRLTQRWQQLDKLNRIFDGRQYEGRPDWWTGVKVEGERPVPLRQRKPCVIYQLPKAATVTVVNFLWGEGRWPACTVPAVEAADSLHGQAISKDDSDTLQKWLSALVERARLKPRQRAIAIKGVSVGTACCVLYVRDGELKLELPQAQDCWAQFRNDDPDADVIRLIWCYEFDKTVIDPGTNRPSTKRYLYRRDWDEVACHVFEDVECKNDGLPIKWVEKEAKPHGLSFCPVIWIRNDPEGGSGIDGRSLYDGSEDQIEILDRTASIRYRGIDYLGTPQLVETGVEEGDGPEPEIIDVQVGDAKRLADQAAGMVAPFGRLQPRQVRRVAPDQIWTYEGKEVKVEMLEVSGQAYEVASNHLRDLRGRLCETWSVVVHNLTDQTGTNTTAQEMSAKFLALAHAPLLSLVSAYRHTWWAFSLERILQMALRMLVDLGPAAFLIPGSDKVSKIATRFYAPVRTDEGETVNRWVGPKIEPCWGRFFDPSDPEVKAAVEAAATAKKESLIMPATATRHVADDFGIIDVQHELDELEEAKIEADTKAAEAADKELEKLNELAHGSARAARPGSPEDAAKAAGDGSGAAAAPQAKGQASAAASGPVGGKSNAQPVAS